MTAPVQPLIDTAPGIQPVELVETSVFYGEVVGLSRVTMSLAPGITAIVGPNGSGKSTLMRVLVGLLRPQEGTARVLGGDPFAQADIRTRINFVPATECFYDGLSGFRNLEAAFVSRGHERPAARRLAEEALVLVDLATDGHRVYRTWSRGMRQRLKLGLALASGADVVLLDEPFLGVDPPNRRQLRDHIAALGAAGRTVLLSSHVLHEVESLTDRVGVLAHGRLLGFGHVHELLTEIQDTHPHRVALDTDRPRELGAELLKRPHVREIAIEGASRVVFITESPEIAYKELPALVAASGVPIRGLETLDHSLEAVFTHVTSTGTHRL